MNKDWNGLLKIMEIQHLDADGKILWEDKNLYNVLHKLGESFILNSVFAGTALPTHYYFGLDNRTTISASDTLSTVTATEPTSYGYTRIAVSAAGAFTVSLQGDHYRAVGPIVSFTSVGGSFGTVRNLFLCTTTTLIASVALSQIITFSSDQTVNMKLSLSLRDC